ncbi:hypothetical protein KDW_53510 [Dictyobacter vulcani]|uniref:Major facilitator superfamily (MFS) profile domain-containing protein n=1 Tax=Dictyobacter vulcani TaxID=2607529 RepID=A0A5J4KYF9_9CHLR|nr:MFS transporter [Dictyobacter vulcani]GER91189.1 hypothetical protein KDW_53510 [Dictyobacter vulcani]
MSNGTIRNSQTFLFIACCFTFIANGLLGVLPGASLVILSQHTHTAPSTAGLIFTVSAFGTIVAVLLSNTLVKKIGSKVVVMVGLLGLIISSVIIPLAQQFSVWLGAEMLQGISAGLINIGITITLTLNFGNKLGEKLNMLHASVGMGSLLAPILLSYSLTLSGSPLLAFLCTALPGVFCLLAFYVLRFETRPGLLGSANANALPLQDSIMPGEPKKALKQTLLWFVALQVCLYVGAEAGFSSWVVTSISQQAAVSIQMATPAATLFWVGMTFGRMLVARLMKRGYLTNAQLLYISMFGGGASAILLTACMQMPVICFIASLGTGIFLGPIFPTLMAIATRRFAQLPGMISSVVLISSGFAGMTIPVSIGMLLPLLGARQVMLIPALMCPLIAVPYYLANRKERKIVDYRQRVQAAEIPIYDLQTVKMPLVEQVA